MDTIRTLPDVRVRPTTHDELPAVIRAEGETDLVRHWTADQHRKVMADPGWRHWILEVAADGRAIGYAIARGIGSPDRAIELKRLLVWERGRGYGRAALRLLKKLAFEDLSAHRLYLDVMEHNQRARALYLSEGFVPEGMLRDGLRVGEGYVSLLLMSILEDEYAKMERGARASALGEGR
jgi:diamine N-acetyltransferase